MRPLLAGRTSRGGGGRAAAAARGARRQAALSDSEVLKDPSNYLDGSLRTHPPSGAASVSGALARSSRRRPVPARILT
jgi:hypothetical protein